MKCGGDPICEVRCKRCGEMKDEVQGIRGRAGRGTDGTRKQGRLACGGRKKVVVQGRIGQGSGR